MICSFLLLNGNQLADDSTSESCGIPAGSVLHVRTGLHGGGRKIDVSRTLFLCGASRCPDIDIEEQVTSITGRGTCRLYLMTNSDRRQCELTTSEAYQLLRQAEWLVVGSRKLRVRRWDPLKAKKEPKKKKPKKSGDKSTTEADQPEQSSDSSPAEPSQTTATGHAMKTVIGRLHYNMDRMKHSLMLLDSVRGHVEIEDDLYETHGLPPGLDVLTAVVAAQGIVSGAPRPHDDGASAGDVAPASAATRDQDHEHDREPVAPPSPAVPRS